MEHAKKRKRTTAWLITAVFVALCVALCAALLAFTASTNSEAGAQTATILETLTANQADHVETVLDEQFRTLETSAAYLGKLGDIDGKTFYDLSDSLFSSERFTRFVAADANGSCVTSDGLSGSIADFPVFQQAVSGNRAISQPLDMDASENGSDVCLLLAVPIKASDGSIVGIFGGALRESSFQKMFAESSVNGSRAALLINDEGDVIASSVDSEAAGTGDNVFDILDTMNFLDDGSLDTARESLEKNEPTAVLAQQADGTPWYATLVPFGYNGWTLLNVVDAQAVNSLYAFVRTNTAYMMAFAAACFLIGLALISRILMRERAYLRAENERIESDRRRLLLSEERYRLLASGTNTIAFEINLAEKTAECNEVFYRQFHEEPSFKGFFEGRRVIPDDRAHYLDLLKRVSGGGIVSGDFRFFGPDRQPVWYSLFLTAVETGSRIERILGKMDNIDQTRRELELLKQRAQTDEATGLFDKAATHDLVEAALKEDALEGRPARRALVIVDIDDFKNVNDTFGHPEGDRVIASVAHVLKTSMRETDIVGRIGGDEFMACLAGIEDAAPLEELAADLLERLSALEAGRNAAAYPVHCSIGCALSREGDAFANLYHRADEALYHAKRAGKQQFRIWTPDMEQPDN